MTDQYEDFLENKLDKVKQTGFDVPIAEINPILFDWQRAVVAWALKSGKAALFEECGLGKTLQQIEWAKHVHQHTGGSVIICSPLAVAYQTIREGKKIGVTVTYVRHQDEVTEPGVYITNYDMLKEIDGSLWAGVVLDESSILKAFMGATKRMILDMFESVPFKLACTATPSPNDNLELGNHAEFLGVMRSNEMIQRFFINDSMEAGGYRLRKHGRKHFWAWVTSWAVGISKPSDIGYPDLCERYSFNMPKLDVRHETVAVDHSRAFAKGELFVDGTLSATSMWAEKRATLKSRCDKAREIVGDSQEAWIIWCETDDESDYLQSVFPAAVDVRGSNSFKEKERKLEAFTDGEYKIIITKPELAGFGLNWQHCRNMIFVSATYSFEKTYQALRRAWRFGQKSDVTAWMVTAESEGEIVKALEEKQKAHTEMQKAMNEAMQDNGLVVTDHREMKFEHQTKIETGKHWKMLLGDCVARIKEIPDNSVDFSVYSPPFSNLYIYSDNLQDMGNSASDAEFFEHYKFLIREKFRITKPGRLSAVHCKDLPLYHNRDGAAGLKDFPGNIVRAHCEDEKMVALNLSRMVMLDMDLDTSEIDKAIALRIKETGPAWVFHSRVTIWKNPVIEMQRTKNHGLLHKNFAARAEVVRQGMPDYVLVFRKWEGVIGTESAEPVKQNRKPGDYVGTEPPERYKSERDYSIAVWQKYASPVWYDINQTNVLNKEQARENSDEKHICPLQLDVIERCIDLWTNPGELVFSPFAGIGSEGYSAVKLRRSFVGIELKESYFNVACRNLRDAELAFRTQNLFDFAGMSAGASAGMAAD